MEIIIILGDGLKRYLYNMPSKYLELGISSYALCKFGSYNLVIICPFLHAFMLKTETIRQKNDFYV